MLNEKLVQIHRYFVGYRSNRPAFAWMGARYLNHIKACKFPSFLLIVKVYNYGLLSKIKLAMADLVLLLAP